MLDMFEVRSENINGLRGRGGSDNTVCTVLLISCPLHVDAPIGINQHVEPGHCRSLAPRCGWGTAWQRKYAEAGEWRKLAALLTLAVCDPRRR